MLPEGFIGAPAYDSGWINVSQGETITLTHNLNTQELFVYVIGKWNYTDVGWAMHQNRYGGDSKRGLQWRKLTDTTIDLRRMDDDQNYDHVRVQIWKIEPTPTPVGGFWVPVDKLTLLAPYIALTSTILVATAATAIYVKRVKRRKKAINTLHLSPFLLSKD